MGERQSGGGHGRRRVHPGAGVPGQQGSDGDDTGGLEQFLADAMRVLPRGDGEQRAVAAFRAARDGGAHRARTRRRDDWRPGEQRKLGRSLKTTLSVLVASLTIGGVAFAAIGTSGSSSDDTADRPRERQPHSAAATSEQADPTPDTATSAPADRPVTAQDTEAHCRSYEKLQGRGNALNSTAWQRLIAAAGGEEKVAAYCARQLAQDRPNKQGKTPVKGNAATGAPGNSEQQPGKAKGKNKP
ncbi:hypothetical protein SAMN06272735_5369 [Streptomyces sp. TLI_55]|uniref:hypothetical protein n=1 Tax=Streptomyces sp. TLI_55 TaxID=1938861 RepID=UPI000BDB7104|nr:hypothetical protein [Streptomyces sp. TLI_55]SNX63559.1 hypothetical protein SAMN06272735_5369 [Streptomyces sp. TLI_55]